MNYEEKLLFEQYLKDFRKKDIIEKRKTIYDQLGILATGIQEINNVKKENIYKVKSIHENLKDFNIKFSDLKYDSDPEYYEKLLCLICFMANSLSELQDDYCKEIKNNYYK